MRTRGWHLQVQLDLAGDPGALGPLCEKVNVPMVVDHLGRCVLAMRAHPCSTCVKTGACWVKLSAPYR